MAATFNTSRAAEGGKDSLGRCCIDLANTNIWSALKGVGGIVGSSRRCAAGGVVGSSHCFAAGNPVDLALACDGGPGGLALACDTLDRGCRVLLRVGDGRPVSIGKGNNLVCRSTKNHCSEQLTYRKSRSDVELGDLPEDVLRKIFSKLHLREVVRTSVLSSKWRRMWMISSRLSFDYIAICGPRRYFCVQQQNTQKFIHRVNMVLQQLHGKVVEELEVRVEFYDMLVDHLNNWVSFAVSSLTKNLVLDLLRAEIRDEKDMYVFPFELFDSASISRIRHVQLSCVSLKPDSQFMGFPNLKKLDLNLFGVSRKNLEDILAGCPSLKWLSLSRCCMSDELTVKKPLDRLMYLRIEYCSITKIELHAENLKTFVYHGARVPIDLGQVKQLETAEVYLYGTTLHDALTVLPNVLVGVENFTLDTYLPLEMPYLLDRTCIFSHLKILRLLLLIDYKGAHNVLSLASFLRAAPSIEKLEVHFDIFPMEGIGWETLQRLPRSSYNYLTNVLITGFYGIKGQLEFLVHIVENAPGLKVLTIDPRRKVGLCLRNHSECMASRAAARKHLDGKFSPSTEVHIL